ncbi:MAG: hypothetical protein HYV27_09935 [Candidatus Hydrogenedentes bacterium]|nr:hypothetical protein [Candidatus Hydrogenedentota bacterium]
MRKRRGNSERGMALVFAMMAIIVILGSMGLVMLNVQNSKKESDRALDMAVLEEAAQAGIDMAINGLWNDYIVSSGNTTGNVASYKYYLNNELVVPVNEDLNFNGVQDTGEEGNGDDVFDTLPSGTDPHGMQYLDEPYALKDPETQRVLATITGVQIARYDTIYESRLTIRSTAEVDGVQKTAVQILEIGGAPFDHGQFAILANNISCILCHANVNSLDLNLNTLPENYGTFDRIKVAALESMLVRKTEADSKVAGTLYTRGNVYNQNGSPYTASDFQTGTFQGYLFDNTDGKLQQNSSGVLSATALDNATANSDGELEQFANLYMNYPKEKEQQTDGPLPDAFPAPYPDVNENRYVDDEEFEVIVNTANGSVDFEYGPEAEEGGSIQAGVAYGVPAGQAYDSNALPTSSNGALDSLKSTGSYEGNLILVGTEDDPIKIDQTVAIDGDLIISGPIRGEGQLLVRGNTYIAGDVTYADAPGQFGKDVDGNDNAFALVSGGSVMMGDYLTVRGVNHTQQNNAQYPDPANFSIHARDTTRTNSVTKTISDVSVTESLKWGYFDPYSVDAGQVVSGRQGQQFSFTQSELMLFNNLEMKKAIADPDYTPRFYGLRESQPNNIYMFDSTQEHAVRYDYAGVKTVASYITAKGLPASILSKAAIHYTSPTGNWISEDQLRHIWHTDEMTRPSAGRDFKFDGLLYSNNAIFAIVRSYARHKSNTLGRMTIRGGVISPDLGIFVPGHLNVGLSLLYDPRVERFLKVQDTESVEFTRAAFFFERGGSEA